MPALFLASEQRRGRGRGDNEWISSQGSLTFSLLVARPVPLNDSRGGMVALLAADSICETVEELCQLSPKIKWPNDVYLNDRKLAGILIESVGATMVVIGCGVNVTNSTDRVPFATNLASLTTTPPSMQVILTGITRRIIVGLTTIANDSGSLNDRLKSTKKPNGCDRDLVARCQSRDWLSGRLIECATPTESVYGTARGFSPDGGLVIEIERGHRRVVSTGSITVLRSQAN